MAGAQPLAAHGEEVAHEGVHRDEPLGLWSRLEAAHGSFALARRLMGDFGHVVATSVRCRGVTERMTARCAAP